MTILPFNDAPTSPPRGRRAMSRLRVIVADDERPARAFLAGMLAGFEDVDVIGEATNGAEAVELIERTAPDLVLLDLQMPEVDGLGVVRLIRRDKMPLIAFVTAYDEYAVRAFQMNAVDYLLKPVDPVDSASRSTARWSVSSAPSCVREMPTAFGRRPRITRPSSRRSCCVDSPFENATTSFLIPVEQVVSIVADGELLHLVTRAGERHTITYRLKDLEARLDPAQFVRISRGTLLNIAHDPEDHTAFRWDLRRRDARRSGASGQSHPGAGST